MKNLNQRFFLLLKIAAVNSARPPARGTETPPQPLQPPITVPSEPPCESDAVSRESLSDEEPLTESEADVSPSDVVCSGIHFV